MSTIEVSFAAVAAGLYLEALAVDDGTVWFGDVIGGGVHRLEPDGSRSSWLPEKRWFGSMALNHDGAVLCSGSDGISWFDPSSGRTGTLLSEVDGSPLPGVNELCPDGRGGLFFGTKDGAAIERAERPRPSALYHLDAGGTARQLCDGLVFTNGIAISPDGGTLYHNETFVGTFAYPLLPDGGLGHPRMLLEKEDCDGMALDREGYLWIVGFSSGELLRMTPDGEIVGRIPVPAGAVTNLRFGGADGSDLYVTSVPLGAGEGLRVGTLPTEPNSVLYRGRSPIAGRVAPRTRFRLQ